MNLINPICVKELNQEERSLLVKQVRRWGGLNTDALLDCNCNLFSIPSIEGFIGYRTEANCAVVFGDPVCALADRPRLAEAFQYYCREQGSHVIYVLISENFAHFLFTQRRGVLIQIGNKLILDPTYHLLKATGPKAVLLRKKVKRALHEGIVITECLCVDPPLEQALEQVGQAWLGSRRGPQIHIAPLNFFNDREGKRWFYAKKEERVIGLLILNQTQETSGWLLNNLIITPHAPPGTSELLITSVLETLEKENCKCVAIGPVTVKQIDHIAGLGTLSSWFVRLLFKAITKIFRLDGQRVFWEKFQPKNEPSYVMFDQVNFQTVKALMRAMNVNIRL